MGGDQARREVDQRAYDAYVQADNRAAASTTANALARIYLESGNVKKAEEKLAESKKLLDEKLISRVQFEQGELALAGV